MPRGWYIRSFWYKLMVGKWSGIDSASIAPSFVENGNGKHSKVNFHHFWTKWLPFLCLHLVFSSPLLPTNRSWKVKVSLFVSARTVGCPDFRRKLSRETPESRFFMIFGFLEKSLQHKMVPGDPSCLQIDPRWSLDAPWVLLDPPKIKLKIRQIQKNKKWTPGNLEICKDARKQIIQIGLVEILSTSTACRLVRNRTHHEH